MSLLDARTIRVLITILLFVLVIGFLYFAHHTLVAFLFAIFFAYLIDPSVSHVAKLTRSRGSAIAVMYLVLLILLATFFFFVGPRIGHETQRLIETLPGLLGKVSSGQIASDIGSQHGWSRATVQQAQSLLLGQRQTLINIAQAVGLRMADVAKQSWLLVVVPILAAFFLKDGRAVNDALLAFARTHAQREFLQGVLGDLNRMLAHFIRAQLTLAALSSVVYITFLSALRVPYALVLGTAGGIMEFVPVVGPVVAALVILGVAVLMGYSHWLLLIILLSAWRLVQDYVVSPRVMGKSMELHPLAALFGVLGGAEIAGVLGVYLSIPVMASLRIVWRRWQLYANKKNFEPGDGKLVKPAMAKR